MKQHAPLLRAEGLIADGEALVGQAADGAIIEIFRWKEEAAIGAAHRNAKVRALWEKFGDAADFTPLAALGEAQAPFEGFPAIES